MTTVGFGPLARIDGPPPITRQYGLLQAADSPAAGVRLLDDLDRDGYERWINGAEVFPYPAVDGSVFDACNGVASPNVKDDAVSGALSFENPQFSAFTAYLPVSCKTYKIWSQDEYKARAVAVFTAKESAIVSSEFMRGTELPSNPHLADGNVGTCVFPNADTATSPANALALLEEQIALSGIQGIIHISPTLLPALTFGNFIIDTKTGVLRTLNGTVLIPDAGYAGGSHPTGHANSSGSKEWMYATGPVDIYQGKDVFVTPEEVSQAVDRGAGIDGATLGNSNYITYRVERYYMAIWDGIVHAAVLADRCQSTC